MSWIDRAASSVASGIGDIIHNPVRVVPIPGLETAVHRAPGVTHIATDAAGAVRGVVHTPISAVNSVINILKHPQALGTNVPATWGGGVKVPGYNSALGAVGIAAMNAPSSPYGKAAPTTALAPPRNTQGTKPPAKKPAAPTKKPATSTQVPGAPPGTVTPVVLPIGTQDTYRPPSTNQQLNTIPANGVGGYGTGGFGAYYPGFFSVGSPPPPQQQIPAYTGLFPDMSGMGPKIDMTSLANLPAQLAALMNYSPSDLSKQAAAVANATIANQVGALRNQQQTYLNEGDRTAADIRAIAEAGGRLAQGMPAQLAGNYNLAANTLANLAGGFSGQLQNVAQQQAAGVTDVYGQPGGTTTAGGVNVATSPEAMQNAMYAMQGTAPAQGMRTAGAAAAEEAAAIPQLELGGARQGSLLALQSAQQKANELLPDITRATGQFPSLYQQNLTDLVSTKQQISQKAADQAIEVAKMQQQAGLDWAKFYGSPLDYFKTVSNAAIQSGRLNADIQHWNQQDWRTWMGQVITAAKADQQAGIAATTPHFAPGAAAALAAGKPTIVHGVSDGHGGTMTIALVPTAHGVQQVPLGYGSTPGPTQITSINDPVTGQPVRVQVHNDGTISTIGGVPVTQQAGHVITRKDGTVWWLDPNVPGGQLTKLPLPKLPTTTKGLTQQQAISYGNGVDRWATGGYKFVKLGPTETNPSTGGRGGAYWEPDPQQPAMDFKSAVERVQGDLHMSKKQAVMYVLSHSTTYQTQVLGQALAGSLTDVSNAFAQALSSLGK